MSSSFTEEQDKAIHASLDHPIAIVACPGSGKTFTIINRIAFILQSGVPADQLLVITFTRKAAQELRQRLSNMGLDVKKLTVSTFHSFGRTILRKYGTLVGYPNFRLLTENEQFNILKEYLPNSEDNSFAFNRKDLLLGLQLYKASKKCENDDIKNAFDKYCKELKEKQLVDFTDLILLPLEIFKHNPQCLQTYTRKYHYALVDEMQDVSQCQFDLIHILYNKTGRITVVGDDDQTIYTWRGADASLLLKFPEQFTNAEVLTLSTCFRCQPLIIKAMSFVIQFNKKRVKKKIKSVLNDSNPQEKYKKVLFIGGIDSQNEATLVVDKIERLLKKDKGSISVLFRTRKSGQYVADELKKRKIQTTKTDSNKDIEGKTSDIIINSLLFIEKKQFNTDIINDSFFTLIIRYINSHYRNYSQFTASLKFNETDAIIAPDLFEEPEFDDDVQIISKENVVKSAEDVRVFLSCLPLKVCIDTIADALDLHDPSLNVIISECETFGSTSHNYSEFADELKELNITDVGHSKVQLTTVHQAKGLEWDHVFVVGVSKNIWPSNRGSTDKEEERRLFYVAMSRARKTLVISSNIRTGFSPFIQDLPEQYVNFKVVQEQTATEEEIQEKQKQLKENTKSFSLGFVSANKLNTEQKQNSQVQTGFISASQMIKQNAKEDNKQKKLSSNGPKLVLVSHEASQKSINSKTEQESKKEDHTQFKPVQTQKQNIPIKTLNRIPLRMGARVMSTLNTKQYAPKPFKLPRQLSQQEKEEDNK